MTARQAPDTPNADPVTARDRQAPPREVLPGQSVRLEPLEPARHGGALFAGARDDPEGKLWTYMAYGPFDDPAVFTAWLEERAAERDPLFFAVIDEASGRAAGMVSYLRIVPAMGVVEIGHIWFAPRLQRTRQATEAIFLLARQAFDGLGYRRLEWKCDALNAASRRAAKRFGFTFEGVFRQHMIVKGHNRDSAWFSILDGEWPAIRGAFEAWLSPGNFDPEGRQKTPLATPR